LDIQTKGNIMHCSSAYGHSTTTVHPETPSSVEEYSHTTNHSDEGSTALGRVIKVLKVIGKVTAAVSGAALLALGALLQAAEIAVSPGLGILLAGLTMGAVVAGVSGKLAPETSAFKWILQGAANAALTAVAANFIPGLLLLNVAGVVPDSLFVENFQVPMLNVF
jgi:hypothetical protein